MSNQEIQEKMKTLRDDLDQVMESEYASEAIRQVQGSIDNAINALNDKANELATKERREELAAQEHARITAKTSAPDDASELYADEGPASG